MTDLKTLAVAFVATFGVVLGGAAVAGFVTADGVDAPPEIENDHYLDEELLNDGTPGTADVTMSSNEPTQTVVIDPGIDAEPGPSVAPLGLLGFGGPAVADRDVRPLVNTLIENGHDVRVHVPNDEQQPVSPSPDADETTELGTELADADAFVTFQADYDADELADIESFVDADGRVLIATDPDEEFDTPGASAGGATLGVTVEPGYAYSLEENDLNYQRVYAESDGDSMLTAGVDRAVFATATPLGTGPGGSAELRPTDGTELSTTRAPTDDPLLVRNDGVVAVGDSDFLSPENAQRADNDILIGNIADFLVMNDRNAASQPPEGNDDPEPEEPEPPTAPPEDSP